MIEGALKELLSARKLELQQALQDAVRQVSTLNNELNLINGLLDPTSGIVKLARGQSGYIGQILNLIRSSEEPLTPKQIINTLSIPLNPQYVYTALSRLGKDGLIQRQPNHKWSAVSNKLENDNA